MGDHETIEALRRRIDELVATRQALRADGATPDALEANRRELAAAQLRLTRALVARSSPSAA